MSFAQALRQYILLLAIAALALVIVMPQSIRFDFGKNNICRLTRALPWICGFASSLPEKIPFTILRPRIDLSLGAFRLERSLDYSYGLDIRGGSEVTLAVDMSEIAAGDRDQALTSAQEVIRRRIDLYGLSESTVVTASSPDSYRLLARIPNMTDTSQIAALIGNTAELTFREYKQATGSAGKLASPSSMLVADFVPTGLTGKDLIRASAEYAPGSTTPIIGLEFSAEGSKKFAEVTRRNIGKPVAIFVDEYPLSAPTVEAEITAGRAQISGEFSPEQARSLAAMLNAGSLPAPISILSQQTVEPSLGSVTITQTIRAGLIGILLVSVFLVLLYGLKGFLGSIALLYYGLLTLALYKLLPVTLSLSGLVGFLLSVGMAVDTMILIFERMREEERKGDASFVVILRRAYRRTWDSIKDANAVTLVTATILANPFGWQFLHTAGIVRGFAITLILGIFLNIFTGMFVTRVLLSLFYRPRQLKSAEIV